MGYKKYNSNPERKNVGDCAVRAISIATDQSWEETYIGLSLQGFLMGDMPSANSVWGAYLRGKGFTRHVIPDKYPDCYTVSDFADDNPHGTYLLALSGHVVCLKDGNWIDSWDSGSEIPLYYWKKG